MISMVALIEAQGVSSCAYCSWGDNFALRCEDGTDGEPVTVEDIGPRVKLLLGDVGLSPEIASQIVLGLVVVGGLPYNLQEICSLLRRQRS